MRLLRAPAIGAAVSRYDEAAASRYDGSRGEQVRRSGGERLGRRVYRSETQAQLAETTRGRGAPSCQILEAADRQSNTVFHRTPDRSLPFGLHRRGGEASGHRGRRARRRERFRRLLTAFEGEA
jgi:hypothetical protein